MNHESLICKSLDKHCRALELDKILIMLSEETACADSTELALNLKPSTDEQEVKSLLKETDDAYVLSMRYQNPSFSGLCNIDKSLSKAKSGGTLSTLELLEIAKVLRVFRMLKDWESRVEKMPDSLKWKFSDVSPNNHLERAISEAVIAEDEISDNASDNLNRIRRKIRSTSLRIREQLDKMIHSSRMQKILQDPIVTIRDGRFVIPVKAEYRNEVSGLVHDTSASGATLFIEPMSVVEANNNIKVLKSDEKNEIVRILFNLSSLVGEFVLSIQKSYLVCVKLNVIFAKANLAYKMKATVPEININGEILLRKARHPLINKDLVVPIDVSLGKDFDTLVVTGPNTGGKTVSLKTVGLLTLMAMCGLMIPVESKSSISIFDHVFADVGDEQSIEQSLSTFSSHMINIIKILDESRKDMAGKKLILLDELGSGTDPVEGAALATSILEELHANGAKVLATTHYAELKSYAIRTNRVENACCEFDVKTLRPTYKLLIGVPGKSSAFEISKKLGIPERIIVRAKDFITEESMCFEEVLGNLEENRQELELEKKKILKFRSEAERMYTEVQQQYDRIELERKKIERDAHEKAAQLVSRTKAEADNILDFLKKKQCNQEFLSSDDRGMLKRKIANLEKTADPVTKINQSTYVLPRELKVGDTVLIIDLDKKATVLTPVDDSGNVLVQAGIIKTRVSIKNLKLVEEKVKKVVGSSTRSVKSRADKKIVRELDIRGCDSIDAIIELDRFIDDAVLSGVNQLTIIHGKGTGVLRKAVHKHLKSHKSVKSYRLGTFGEGESGVTIVELKG